MQFDFEPDLIIISAPSYPSDRRKLMIIFKELLLVCDVGGNYYNPTAEAGYPSGTKGTSVQHKPKIDGNVLRLCNSSYGNMASSIYTYTAFKFVE